MKQRTTQGVLNWYLCFKKGRSSLEDKIMELVHKDCQKTNHNTGGIINVSHGTVQALDLNVHAPYQTVKISSSRCV